jgi:hypothetical protein
MDEHGYFCIYTTGQSTKNGKPIYWFSWDRMQWEGARML